MSRLMSGQRMHIEDVKTHILCRDGQQKVSGWRRWMEDGKTQRLTCYAGKDGSANQPEKANRGEQMEA